MSHYVIPLVLLLFVVFLFTRQRGARQRQVAQQRDMVQVGARVMTTSGLHGTIVGVEGDTVELEIAPGVRTTWLARAVARRLDDPVAADPTGPGAAALDAGAEGPRADGPADATAPTDPAAPAGGTPLPRTTGATGATGATARGDDAEGTPRPDAS